MRTILRKTLKNTQKFDEKFLGDLVILVLMVGYLLAIVPLI